MTIYPKDLFNVIMFALCLIFLPILLNKDYALFISCVGLILSIICFIISKKSLYKPYRTYFNCTCFFNFGIFIMVLLKFFNIEIF